MNRDALITTLRGLLGDRVATGDAVREHHSRGESHHHGVLPDAVVFPTSTAEVQAIVTACAAENCPMTPFGAGSSLEGHVIPLQGGITIDLSRMTRVLRLSVEDLDVTVEAGVTRKQLEKHLQTSGLWFPLDPGADATIGGMAATRASGTTAVRYGTMRDAVLGLTVVTADGNVVIDGHARAQVVGGLRPHAALRRRRGHARDHHRRDASALRPARSGRRRRHAGSIDRRRGERRDHDRPARHSRRADRAARRRADRRRGTNSRR